MEQEIFGQRNYGSKSGDSSDINGKVELHGWLITTLKILVCFQICIHQSIWKSFLCRMGKLHMFGSLPSSRFVTPH
jgi:hypothetical protein